MSGSYRKMFNDKLPDATQDVDPLDLVELAGERLDNVRRRVQPEATDHCGHNTTYRPASVAFGSWPRNV